MNTTIIDLGDLVALRPRALSMLDRIVVGPRPEESEVRALLAEEQAIERRIIEELLALVTDDAVTAEVRSLVVAEAGDKHATPEAVRRHAERAADDVRYILSTISGAGAVGVSFDALRYELDEPEEVAR